MLHLYKLPDLLTIIIGAVWGDEGKGAIVDRLSKGADIVARYQGGGNAGHTVTIKDETKKEDVIYKLHLIPSGILRDYIISVLGNGMVIDPTKLLEELNGLEQQQVNISPERLRISHAAHLTTPGEVALDIARDQARGQGKIGTTGRGIGPTYEAKASRDGLRMEIFCDPTTIKAKVAEYINQVNKKLVRLYQAAALPAQEIADQYEDYAVRLQPYITNTASLLYTALQQGKRVLAEGAQGTLLDVDHGSYPFVTSSNATVGGAFTGLGIGPQKSQRIIGVVKAFQTRVGEGPFPTELHDEIADRLRGDRSQPWAEYGTTTGRPRRVGWLDTLLLRYAVEVNGLTELAITKLDVLSGVPEPKLCVAYRQNGSIYQAIPLGLSDLAGYTPELESVEGWTEDISTATHLEQLPAQARNFLARVSKLAHGTRISMISVGARRDQLIQT